MEYNVFWQKIKDVVWDVKYCTIIGIFIGIAYLFGQLIALVVVLSIIAITLVYCYEESRPIEEVPFFFPGYLWKQNR